VDSTVFKEFPYFSNTNTRTVEISSGTTVGWGSGGNAAAAATVRAVVTPTVPISIDDGNPSPEFHTRNFPRRLYNIQLLINVTINYYFRKIVFQIQVKLNYLHYSCVPGVAQSFHELIATHPGLDDLQQSL